VYIDELIERCISLCNDKTVKFTDKDIRDLMKLKNISYEAIWRKNYCFQFFCDVLRHKEEYQYIYESLSDRYSKGVFEEIFIKRALYIISEEDDYDYKYYMKKENYIQKYIDTKNNAFIKNVEDSNVDKNKSSIFYWKGYEILSDIKNIVALEFDQYSYFDKVIVEEGDVVLDCGASQGEEVFYFNTKADNISIHSFLLTSEEKDAYLKNMETNKIDNYVLNNLAIWDKTGISLSYVNDGSRSRIISDGKSYTKSIRLDDYLKKNDIQNNLFVKMDIEGAEVAALSGAKDVLERKNTKYAISVYHNPNDIRIIASIIRKANISEGLFLRQCKDNISETVLYAK